MNAQLPDIKQLQPVIDNTDPNNIRVGNPGLKQSFTNNANVNYYFYKGISDINLYAGGTFNQTIGEVTEKTYYDSIGRAVHTPVNVNGNYFGNFYVGGGVPLFKKFIKVDYNFNMSHSNSVGYVNDLINVTQNTNYSPGLWFEKEFGEVFEIRVGGNYTYNVPKQTISLQSNKPYYTYGLEGSFRLKLFERLNISAEANYTDNGNRAVGYNIDYTILNASASYSFLKAKNLIIGVEANDILNQNINNRRDVQANRIVDTKTQIIRQYFLARITYKFTSQKEKKEDMDED
jgi:hypothetical protein